MEPKDRNEEKLCTVIVINCSIDLRFTILRSFLFPFFSHLFSFLRSLACIYTKQNSGSASNDQDSPFQHIMILEREKLVRVFKSKSSTIKFYLTVKIGLFFKSYLVFSRYLSQNEQRNIEQKLRVVNYTSKYN